MIDARELRIGNWVLFNGKEKMLFQFDHSLKFISFGTAKSHESPGIPHEEIYPVPITEERLLKLGFSKMTIKPLWRKTEGKFTLESDDFLFSFENKHIYADSGLTLHPIGNEIKFIHTLQNIFYILTGNELTLQS